MAAPDPAELPKVIDLASREAARYLESIADRDVRDPRAEEVAMSFRGDLPEDGVGAEQALQELLAGIDGAVHSAGPKFFHFVNGGTTPAALGADWLASTLDQNVGAWVSSPLAGQLEWIAIEWLLDLFGLPSDWGGVLTTGATMANFVGLACARRWCGLQRGVDVDEVGLAGLPPIQVFGSGFIHPSDIKALGMLGVGRAQVYKLTKDGVGRLDVEALDDALANLDGAPAIVIGSAGEVNAGDFDPIGVMADLAHRHGAWFHVDGAFGLFAALSERTRHLVEGVERADSVIADGHKWLNVRYDCGFAFVRDARLLNAVFGMGAPYFPATEADHPDFLYLAPEMSRRARALAVWATLNAYGRRGYRAMIERHVALAKRLADQIRDSSDFELLEEPRLNVVCFRYRPAGSPEGELDEINRRLGQAIIADGTVYFGTTVYGGKVAFRPAIANWRTTERDVDIILGVARGLAERIAEVRQPT